MTNVPVYVVLGFRQVRMFRVRRLSRCTSLRTVQGNITTNSWTACRTYTMRYLPISMRCILHCIEYSFKDYSPIIIIYIFRGEEYESFNNELSVSPIQERISVTPTIFKFKKCEELQEYLLYIYLKWRFAEKRDFSGNLSS